MWPHPRRPGLAPLEDLIDVINGSRSGTILDLDGLTFTSATSGPFRLHRDGVTLRHGHLKLTAGQLEDVLVTGHDAGEHVLDWDAPRAMVSGVGPIHLRLIDCKLEGAAGNEAVVSADSGCHVELRKGCSKGGIPGCQVLNNLHGVGVLAKGEGSTVAATGAVVCGHKSSCVSARYGGNVELEGCQLSGGKGCSVFVHGEGSRARGCKMEGNHDSGVVVCGGGMATLEGCQLSGSKGMHGMTVRGKGSLAKAKGCQLVDNTASNLAVEDGGVAELQGCQMSGSKQRHGMIVHGEGSRAGAVGCKLVDNERTNLVVEAGGVVEQHGCQLRGSKRRYDVAVQGEGSSVEAKNCEMVGNLSSSVLVDAGGMAPLEGCQLSGSVGGNGLKVHGKGSRAEAKGCKLVDNEAT